MQSLETAILTLIRYLCKLMVSIFYRDVQQMNSQNIPKRQEIPTIVYCNHNNLFFDGIILGAVLNRAGHMIVANVTFHSKFIGSLLKINQSVPLLVKQTPKKVAIKRIQNGIAQGYLNSFACLSQDTQLLLTCNDNTSYFLQIQKVINTNEIKLKNIPSELQSKLKNPTQCKVLDKNRYEKLFASAYQKLNKNRIIGLFPQFTHEFAQQLGKFKPGIGHLALQFQTRFKKDVKIVPCGYNFYRIDAFRAKIVMQFGQAIYLDKQLLQSYQTNRHEAAATLTQKLSKQLKKCLTQLKQPFSYGHLCILRKILTNIHFPNVKLQMQQKVRINRLIAKYLNNFPAQKSDDLSFLFQKLLKKEQRLGYQWNQIEKKGIKSQKICQYLILIGYASLIILNVAWLSLWLTLFYPFQLVAQFKAQRQKQSLENLSKLSSHYQCRKDIINSKRAVHGIPLHILAITIYITGGFFHMNYNLEYSASSTILFSILFLVIILVYFVCCLKSYDAICKQIKKLKWFKSLVLNPKQIVQFQKLVNEVQAKYLVQIPMQTIQNVKKQALKHDFRQ